MSVPNLASRKPNRSREKDLSKRDHRDDIAVVGMSCRFPGLANSPEDFWKILSEGRDVVTEVDASRWSKEHFFHENQQQIGRSYTWSAGILEHIDKFDAEFFGISPREAAQMDPQQRLLLEMVWEALEDGAQIPERLSQSNCGVYIGISGTDYANSRLDDPASSDAYTMTGGTLSIAANRISYLFNLHGPSMAIDTACSSSLVALHQACQSIWGGETNSAIAGGINLLLTPFNFIGFSRASMLSPTGLCRAFDASGDGYVRAEGGAIVYLKPLARAKRDGDPIHAVIAATGVNSDGRTKGLSMPNTSAQERLLREVYSAAKLNPQDLVYLEAHGTGTAAGDPQEAGAIGRALGIPRGADNPLRIGSVKTNIGHLEPASGMAGVLKSILALKHGTIPKTLHVEALNPAIPFGDLNLEVVTEPQPVEKAGQGGDLIGVNSFGFGGTNAHVVLKRFIPPQSRRTSRSKPAPLVLSARSESALSEMAGAHAALLRAPDPPSPYALAYNAALRRQQHAHRAVVWGDDVQSVLDGLDALQQGEQAVNTVRGRAVAGDTPVVLLFSGNGSQWAGMGQSLLGADRDFRRKVDEFDALFQPMAGFSIIERITAEAEAAEFERTDIAQPALFALQAGLLASMEAKGLRADYVLGHSVGEVAAAYASGAFDLAQATRLIYERSQAQALTRGAGRMAAVGLSADASREAIDALGLDVEIAAYNSANAVTVSGQVADLEQLGDALAERECFYRILDLDYAFHSKVMDPVKERLLDALGKHGLEPSNSAVAMISTVTGEMVTGDDLDPHYWWHNIRQPVRLDRALAQILDQCSPVIIEVGPQPIMQAYVRESLRAANHSGVSLHTIERGGNEAHATWQAVLGAHCHGASLDLRALFPTKTPGAPLPPYPWQRESYWYESTNESLSLLGPRYEHPLLGYRVPRTESTWEAYLDTVALPYLADHVIDGVAVFPAAGFVEMALAASAFLSEGPNHAIEQLTLLSPLLLSEDETKVVQFRLLGNDRSFEIRARPRLSEDPWTVHARGRLALPSKRRAPPAADVGESWSRHAEQFPASVHYRRAAAAGLEYGNAFQTVDTVFVGERETRLNLRLPLEIETELADYWLHPSLLDGCLQSLVDTLAADTDSAGQQGLSFLPFQLDRLVYYGEGNRARHCRASITQKSAHSLLADFVLFDGSGKVIAECRGFRFRRMRLGRGTRIGISSYAMGLKLAPRVEDQTQGSLPTAETLADTLLEELAEQWYAMHRTDHYGEVLPLLDALVASYAFRALSELKGGRTEFDVKELMRSTGIAAENETWLNWLLALLEEDRLAERDGLLWRLTEAEEVLAPDEIWRVLLADFPSYMAEITLVGRLGTHLSERLRNNYEPRAVIFNGKQSSAADQLLEFSPALRITERAARDVLAAIAKDYPENRSLRVLELSLGSGALSAEIAQALPENRGQYVLACEGERAALATATLADCWQVEVAEVDFSEDLSDQGLCEHGFDVVLFTHVLHSVDNPRALLANVRRLLVANGVLIALERPAERLSDLLFGADPRWWSRSRHPRSPQSRLRDSSAWQELIEQVGFSGAIELAEPAPDVAASSYLVLATNPQLTTSASAPPSQRRVLLVSEPAGESHVIATGVKSTLEASGNAVLLAMSGEQFESGNKGLRLSPTEPAHWERLFKQLAHAQANVDEVVYLLGLELSPGQDKAVESVSAQARRCLPLVHIVNALRVTSAGTTLPRIWLVGAGSTGLEDAAAGTPNPSQAPLRGLGRVLENEHPDIGWRLLDLVTNGNAEEAVRLLASEIISPDDEDEIIRSTEARYALRLQPADNDHNGLHTLPNPGEGFRLDFSLPGPLNHLRWRADLGDEPGPGEIRIKVEATGLNFRDVMYAMGMLSEEAVENGFAGASLGMECAGDVIAIGPDVTGFEVGDPVLCFAQACFSRYVTTPTTAVAHKPRTWSYTEAATVPSVFFTTYYALQHLASLEAGEKILIHGAAGGVGLAAIQLARHCNAEIFATAGSEEKRDFLKLLGVEHILDSRSLAFADEILDITNGEGVDVVLNSLSGEAVLKSLEVLKPFGRFLELGKRDFYENAKIGLRPFRNNITYFGIDADQLLIERSALAGKLFREMMALFEQGALRPLVHSEFPCTRVIDAFRHMQQSRHIGKIVVTYDDPPRIAREPPARASDFRLHPDNCYFISGGFGGFGLATARWLARHGARHIALAGRHGPSDEDAATAIDSLEAQGVDVHSLAVDVTDQEALQQALKPFGHQLPPIKGVVHAAMVLDDGLSQSMTTESFEKVLAPKIAGAWNLHHCTQNLDFFVLYSSATTDFGNPGQANYVAANLYLQALAAYRRRLGLPAVSVGWGPIADVGYLARNEQVRAALDARVGGQALSSDAALEWLEWLIGTDRSGRSVANVDWHTLYKTLPAARLAKFEDLFSGADNRADANAAEDLRGLMANLSPDELDTLVSDILIEQIAKVMRTSPGKLDVNQSVYDLGMDSLMAVELHLGLEEQFGINIPIMAVTEGASIAKLSARIVNQLAGETKVDLREQPTQSAVTKLAAQHGEDVGEEEIQSLVDEMLNPDTAHKRLIQ